MVPVANPKAECPDIFTLSLKHLTKKLLSRDIQVGSTEDERIEVVDGDPWFYFSREPGSSKLLSALGRKPIGVGTSRNWNTVRGICRMLG